MCQKGVAFLLFHGVQVLQINIPTRDVATCFHGVHSKRNWKNNLQLFQDNLPKEVKRGVPLQNTFNLQDGSPSVVEVNDQSALFVYKFLA